MYQWFDCRLPGCRGFTGISRPKAENCTGFPPPLDSHVLETELLKSVSHKYITPKNDIITIIFQINICFECIKEMSHRDVSFMHPKHTLFCFFLFVCLFDLILYVPSTIFQLNKDGSSWVEPVLS